MILKKVEFAQVVSDVTGMFYQLEYRYFRLIENTITFSTASALLIVDLGSNVYSVTPRSHGILSFRISTTIKSSSLWSLSDFHLIFKKKKKRSYFNRISGSMRSTKSVLPLISLILSVRFWFCVRLEHSVWHLARCRSYLTHHFDCV